MVQGSVPGSKGAWVTVKDSVKKLTIVTEANRSNAEEAKVEPVKMATTANGDK